MWRPALMWLKLKKTRRSHRSQAKPVSWMGLDQKFANLTRFSSLPHRHSSPFVSLHVFLSLCPGILCLRHLFALFGLAFCLPPRAVLRGFYPGHFACHISSDNAIGRALLIIGGCRDRLCARTLSTGRPCGPLIRGRHRDTDNGKQNHPVTLGRSVQKISWLLLKLLHQAFRPFPHERYFRQGITLSIIHNGEQYHWQP